MPCVNYVKEHIAFIEYAADNGLSSSERLVWYALLHIMNQRANGANWPDGFIRIKNDRILTYAPLGFDAMAKARNSLQQRGLLSYKRGNKNTDTPMYELHYLTVANDPALHDGAELSTVYPECYPIKTDNKGGNMGGNVWGNMGGNAQGKQGDLYYKHKQGITERKPLDDAEDDADEQPRGRMRGYDLCDGAFVDEDAESIAQMNALAGAAASAIRNCFGRDATPAEARSIALKARLSGFGADMLSKALEIAATRGARTPAAYISRIFDDWRFEEVTTPDEADEYQFMADARDGRNMYGSGDAMTDSNRMKQAREERRAKHEAARGRG